MFPQHQRRLSLAALLIGAVGIGFAPIFVRLSETGPVGTAFYRLLFALPILWIWKHWERAQTHSPAQVASRGKIIALAGVFFALDLACWHWSIRLTTVANSTLLSNFAPFFVTLGAWLLFAERITVFLILGLLLAFLGGMMLVGASLHLTAEHVMGDLLGLLTAIFYGSYLLTVKYLRRFCSTAEILSGSGIASSVVLLAIAAMGREPLFPKSIYGWMILLALALLSHVCGQGLITYALAHLPASFSSVSLLFQPVMAAGLAWFLLDERLDWIQLTGGCVVLSGIAMATLGRDG